MKYYGITHPIDSMALQRLWRKFLCKRNFHLFDEVYTWDKGIVNYLNCDACGLMVHIDRVDETYKE